MQFERLSAPLGAIVPDLEVRDLDDAAWGELNDLFCKYHLLVMPGQQLTPDEQMAFASRWGKLIRHPYAGMKDYPDIIELKNVGKARDVNQHWHSDMTYNPVPPKLTMLYAHAAPAIGGDTAFANQALAYAELSAGLKAVIDQLQAEHSAAGLATIYKEDSAEAPRAVHPVVRTHDETGERALYVCRAFTRKLVGWTRPGEQTVARIPVRTFGAPGVSGAAPLAGRRSRDVG